MIAMPKSKSLTTIPAAFSLNSAVSSASTMLSLSISPYLTPFTSIQPSAAVRVTIVSGGRSLPTEYSVPSINIEVSSKSSIFRLLKSLVSNAQLILPFPSKSSTQYGPFRPTKACTFDAPMVIKESSVLVAPPAGMLRGKSLVGKPSVSRSVIASLVSPDSRPSVTSTVCTGPISKAKLPVTCTNSEICSATFSTTAPMR